MESPPDELIRLLMPAERILIFTGAGVSTASGIPDYRGPQGVWKTRRPVEFADFCSDPEARLHYWQQKTEDWFAYHELQPNPVHQAIAQLDAAGRLLGLITQNVDGLHAAAGHDPNRLIEIHGNIREVECLDCGVRKPAGPFYEAFRKDATPAWCETCGGWFKPATISFGQDLRAGDLQRAQEFVLQADLVLALGTTLEVQPAASFTIAAARMGIPYVIINQGPTAHDGLPHVSLRIDDDLVAHFPPAVEAALAMGG